MANKTGDGNSNYNGDNAVAKLPHNRDSRRGEFDSVPNIQSRQSNGMADSYLRNVHFPQSGQLVLVRWLFDVETDQPEATESAKHANKQFMSRGFYHFMLSSFATTTTGSLTLLMVQSYVHIMSFFPNG